MKGTAMKKVTSDIESIEAEVIDDAPPAEEPQEEAQEETREETQEEIPVLRTFLNLLQERIIMELRDQVPTLPEEEYPRAIAVAVSKVLETTARGAVYQYRTGASSEEVVVIQVNTMQNTDPATAQSFPVVYEAGFPNAVDPNAPTARGWTQTEAIGELILAMGPALGIQVTEG
jgi:hypothetical protein